MKRLSMRRSMVVSKDELRNTIDERDKREDKRKRFKWLNLFLAQRRPSKKTLEEKGILVPEPIVPENKYFAIPISNIVQDKSRLVEGIPKPVYHTIEALSNWIGVEGIFRVSGIFSEMNRMKQTYENGGVPDYSKCDSYHSIAGLLELWFRELPEPVTTCALYDQFMASVGNKISEEESVERLKSCCKSLPHDNQMVLAFFLRFMHRVSLREEENKMGAKNLGVVFGSILLGNGSMVFSLEMKQLLQNQNTIVQYMIAHVDEIFPE